MDAATIHNMANEEHFILTHIASMPPLSEEVLGDVIKQLICKALAYGQVLMMVGGYIVKGVKLACGKRARAVRRSDGAFEMAKPGAYTWAIMDALPAAADAEAAAAGTAATAATATMGIGNHVLAITNTPSTPSQKLITRLEEQAQIETKELPPVQQRIQIFEKFITNDDDDDDDDRQKILDDNEHARLAKYTVGKQPTIVIRNNDDTVEIIKMLLDKVIDLERQVKNSNGGNQAISSTILMHKRIDTLIIPNTIIQMVTDKLQGTGDVWQKSLGYEDFNEKIHKWAVDVMKTGKWPKPQMIAGSITDVTRAVKQKSTESNGKRIMEETIIKMK